MVHHFPSVPHFIIVGSMKCGTTSLHHWLMRSSDVFMKRSEVHFFNTDREFRRGSSRYTEMLTDRATVPANLKIGDDTPTYSYLPQIPARIKEMCPEVKLLWIMRNPLDRSISNYWHAVQAGLEWREINEAFDDELNNRTRNIWMMYIRRSQYLWQVQNFLRYFSQDKIHFIDFNKFITKDETELNNVCEFLEIRRPPRNIPHANQTSLYPRPYLNKLLGTRSHRFLRWIVHRTTSYHPSSRPTLREDIERKVEKILISESDQLYKTTGLQIFS